MNIQKWVDENQEKLGLKKSCQIIIEEKLDGCGKAELFNYKIFFDKKYYESLNEPETKAAVLHEVAHLSKPHTRNEIILAISSFVLLNLISYFIFPNVYQIIIFFLSIVFALASILFYHRVFHEYACDNFSKEYEGGKYKIHLIEAIRKTEICSSKKLNLKTLVPILSHPNNEDRIRRIMKEQ